MRDYTTVILLKELNDMLSRNIISTDFKVIVPNELGLDAEASTTNISTEYDEFEIEPITDSPITVVNLIEALGVAKDVPVYVWSVHGGKMVQASSIGINLKYPSIRIY